MAAKYGGLKAAIMALSLAGVLAGWGYFDSGANADQGQSSTQTSQQHAVKVRKSRGS